MKTKEIVDVGALITKSKLVLNEGEFLIYCNGQFDGILLEGDMNNFPFNVFGFARYPVIVKDLTEEELLEINSVIIKAGDDSTEDLDYIEDNGIYWMPDEKKWVIAVDDLNSPRTDCLDVLEMLLDAATKEISKRETY